MTKRKKLYKKMMNIKRNNIPKARRFGVRMTQKDATSYLSGFEKLMKKINGK